MKIAVIGCGGSGGAHARTYGGLSDVSELICLDIDVARAEAMGFDGLKVPDAVHDGSLLAALALNATS